MRTVKRLLSLSRDESGLFLQALVWVAAVRAGLAVLPYTVYCSWLEIAKRRAPLFWPRTLPINQVMWAVEAACRCVPGSACLVKSHAAELLLAWCGQDAVTCFGVARSEHGQIRAHAWLEVNGTTALGATGEEKFTVLRKRCL